MNKKLSWLCIGALVFALIGCDCVRIKRLAGEQHIYENQNNLTVKNQDENPLVIPESQTVVVNNSGDGDKETNVTNNLGDGNGDGGLDSNWQDSEIGGTAYHDDTGMRGNTQLDNTTTDSMNAKNINLIVNVMADYPRGPLESNTIMLDGAQIYSPHKVGPGQKTLEVSANGYQSASKVINVPKGSTEHIVDVELLAKPRPVKFQFKDSKTGKNIRADQVIIGASTVRDGGKVKPGKHTLEISKKGYQTYIGSITIDPGTSPYVIRRKLDPENRTVTRIKWIIYTEYPAQEEIPVPETVLLDGAEIEQGNKISSGSHQIIVKHPGHETLRKNISVPAGMKVYTFKGTMATLPRRVESNVTYDVPPPSSLGDTSITLVSQRSGRTINVTDNTSVKPGEYKLKISKRGYLPVDKTIRIYPLLSAYNIEEMLEAKPVKIRTIINYDINPPANLPRPSAVFVGRSVQFKIFDGGSIKPGRYSYKITQPGYLMQGGQKQINILPSEDVYEIRESMNVQPRQISFDINQNGILVNIQEIFIDGEKVTFDKTFTPGKQYRLVAKFREYQTVQRTITITPGEGPFRLNVPLVRK
ncbi:hypothetical protein [Candidatus Uabimicrobium amorphum]|uniref:PEGA domain-containing protein n=1 Tax=Uabimicrobium amorphum TaxID=2596890 RepID=A0A5S9IJZ2_UABAM|nr:hypothetical protein [Candidatus Uabimicrobium amorphum]BBM83248.1 hypothetical protein UABAM_01599 [Candidatus Uabimicrobium amorphum]